MGGSASPPAASPTQRRPVPPPLPNPSTSTVPFSWEQQPGVPKSRNQRKDQIKDVGAKVTFLPLPLPPVPIGSSFRIIPTSNKERHVPISSGCRKIKQQQVHLAKLFPVTDTNHDQAQKATSKTGHDDPFSLALARCAEEARRPNTAPSRLPSPPSTQRRTAPSASRWVGSKIKTNGSGSKARLSSAFRPLDLYGSCSSNNAGNCRSSVVDSTVTVPRRSSTSDAADHYGRQNRQYVAYTILYGRHG